MRHCARPELDTQGGSLTRRCVDIEGFGQAAQSSEAGPGASGRRHAITQARREAGDARPAIECQDLEPVDAGSLQDSQQDLTIARVLEDVGAGLGDTQADLARLSRIEAARRAQLQSGAARSAHVATLADRDTNLWQHLGGAQRQRAMVTRVPFPGAVSIENSLDSRRAPLKPSPSPPPVE